MARVRRTWPANTKLTQARLAQPSPTGSGQPMTRQELAQAINDYLWTKHNTRGHLDAKYITKLENGTHIWPHHHYREAFRTVLHAQTDSQLGFHPTRQPRNPPPPTPRPEPHEDVGQRSASLPNIAGADEVRLQVRSALGSPLAAALARGAEAAWDGDVLTIATPAGRYFDGLPVDGQAHAAVEDGRVLAAVPADYANSEFLRRPRRGLVIGVVGQDEHTCGFGLDTRHARRRLVKAGDAARLLIPPSYALDELTMGILWAVVNLDEPLLYDDRLLTDLERELLAYEQMTGSSVGGDLASDLTPVSRMWLGSEFCARHILRHLEDLDQVPQFWTREQRGEEASTWLLFGHKYQYLQAVADRYAGTSLSRAFCIPPNTVAASMPAERVLLLLAAALMESFSIRVYVSADPEYAGVEGFVLDPGRRAIVANWVGADGIWRVGVTADRSAVRDYREVVGHAGARTVVPGQSSGRRLQAMADYLELDWRWLTQRCAEIGAVGCAGLAEPRSRLLSVSGLDRACRYVGQLGSPSD